MNRRRFLVVCTGMASATICPDFGVTPKPALGVVLDRPLTQMPADFMGFSYETAQLADPTYFSAAHAALVAQFRKLGNRGTLRIGGNLSDLTLWGGLANDARAIPDQANIKARFEWGLVTRRAGINRPATITAESIAALGEFLKATEWKLIYGLNLGTGTPERAAEEAACVVESTGASLVAFQVGNEPDRFAGLLRPRNWDFNRYWDEYQTYVKAVRARVPRAPFAGPDVAVNTDWARQFAGRAKGDAVLLTSHYYAMGPPERPEMNAERLLRRDPRLAGEAAMMVAAAKAAGMQYRLTEGNSCFHGGKPGVSDSFASALWAADYLLFLAQAGCAGVNVQTGGEGDYAAFVEEQNRLKDRPLFFGLQFAQRFAGATFRETRLEAKGNVCAYAARRGDEVLLALINKDAIPVEVTVAGLPVGRTITDNWLLSAPTLEETTSIEWRQTEVRDSLAMFSVPPHTARLTIIDLIS